MSDITVIHIWHIRRLTSELLESRHLTSDIRCLTSNTRYTGMSDIRHHTYIGNQTSDSRQRTWDVWHQTSHIFYTSDVWHLLVNICNLSSDVWYTISDIRHVLEIRHLTGDIGRPISVIRQLTSNIRRLTSDITHIGNQMSSWQQTLDIRRLISVVRQLTFNIRHQTSDIRHHTYITHQTSYIIWPTLGP